MGDEVTLQEQIALLYSLEQWWGYPTRLLTLIIGTTIAIWLSGKLVRRFVRYALATDRMVVSERRARTLEGLLSGLATLILSTIAIVWGLLLLGASGGILFPALGLFAAGFGLGVRPLVSDYLAGFTLLFEFYYAYGEKVEIMDVIGTVEHVGLRTTTVRADSGELYVVPNGDVRVIRNFSRGNFSSASVHVLVAPRDLAGVVETLQQVAADALERYPEELTELPEVLSDSGELSARTKITLVAKARFSHGAPLRRQLMIDIHQALAAAGIEEV